MNPHEITFPKIATQIILCLQEAEEKYFHLEKIDQSIFAQVGQEGLWKPQDNLWEIPLRPRDGVVIDPMIFLEMLRDVISRKGKKFFEDEDYLGIAFPIQESFVLFQILKMIQEEGESQSLMIESPIGVLKIIFKEE